MSAPKIVVVAGPTATGKTRLGILLAQALDGEIVSADSMQVYRRMDVGTAKATPEERAAARHHMLDVAEPWENYSVSRYVDEASACCEDILSRGKLPIVVGGTGLYIDSLLAGRDFAGRSEGDESLRAALSARWDAEGGEALLEELRSFDPERAAKLHPSDKRRIVRAIEIYRLTGETISAHDARTRALPPRYEGLRIHLNYRFRAELYARIDARVDAMAENGLFEEVAALLDGGVPRAPRLHGHAGHRLQGGGRRAARRALPRRGDRTHQAVQPPLRQAAAHLVFTHEGRARDPLGRRSGF